ncbi:uncharacterized protein [Clytia hemisphaerica]|uniref:BPL/LPL catalytic domain-containing protein n=1 Tax=Clytia hemisphaerica TaxID=252671 RepID=A0A7M5X8G1_9CNID
MLTQLRQQLAKNNLSSIVGAARIKTKPPNIVIKTDCVQSYEKALSVLNSVIDKERYTLHHVVSKNFLQGSWKGSCSLLLYNVVDELCEQSKPLIQSYVQDCDGKVIIYSDNTESNTSLQDIKEFTNDINKQYPHQMVMFEECIDSIKKYDLVFVLKLMGMSCTEETQPPSGEHLLTNAYLLSSKKVEDIFALNDEGSVKGKDITLKFSPQNGSHKTTNDEFVVITNTSKNDIKSSFDVEFYQSKLKTVKYGQDIIVTEVINSTHTIFTGVNVNSIQSDGLVVHARRQLKGKGRTGNQWLSPLGCMMFSMQFDIPMNSPLGRSLSMIQHLVIVAFVKSIKERGDGYKDLALGIKWPNDIYIDGKIKIGGIIVNTCLWQNDFKVTVGLGVNISNDKPTDCLNSLIRHYNQTKGAQLKELVIEDVLAATLNEIENLVYVFQNEGAQRFKDEYYQYWLHSGRKVTLESYNMRQAEVVGIDDYGYLVVKILQNGEIVTLQPDGNSFDMMKNMIKIKS